ncbi:hypothetical protein FOZ63_013799, partial [Perkinsus olseni]
ECRLIGEIVSRNKTRLTCFPLKKQHGRPEIVVCIEGDLITEGSAKWTMHDGPSAGSQVQMGTTCGIDSVKSFDSKGEVFDSNGPITLSRDMCAAPAALSRMWRCGFSTTSPGHIFDTECLAGIPTGYPVPL